MHNIESVNTTEYDLLELYGELFQPIKILLISDYDESICTPGLIYNVQEGHDKDIDSPAYIGLVLEDDIYRLIMPQIQLAHNIKSPVVIGESSVIPGFCEFFVYPDPKVNGPKIH